jgi:glycosyltransferase involved in cell wall biosynthesis
LTPELSVVVPCYNESGVLPRLLEAFASAGAGSDFELILVDNGSTDATPETLARELPRFGFARSLRLESNRGYGGGILAGVATACGRYTCWTHADLQFPVAAVFEGLALARVCGPRTLVKGRRLCRPFPDRFFTWALALLYSCLLGTRLRDMGGQPTVFPAGLLEGALAPSDFTIDAFTLALALKKGWRVERYGVPVALRDFSGSSWNSGLASRLKMAAHFMSVVPALRASLKKACLPL